MIRVAQALAVTVALMLSNTAQLAAQAQIDVPAGTQVPLSFSTRVDSSTAREGDPVTFAVAQDVLIDRQVVIRKGTGAQGLVVSVTPPGIFGRNARVHVAFVQTAAVDGLPIKLAPIDITPGNLRETKDAAGAAGASVAGLILLGPVGVAAGALIRGGHVTIPPGAVAVTSTVGLNKVKVQ